MNELHLFAGCGGGILGGMLVGHTCVCAVELDSYCRQVLLQRQRDGLLPRFPIWDDVRTFDGRDWQGNVDIVCGGFPCQDISAAGKGVGITGARSGLWSEMARIVSEVRPRYVFVENSPLLVQRGLAVVLSDLARMGFDARWGVISAEDAAWLGAAPSVYHERRRLWIVAESTDTIRTVSESGAGGRRVREVGTEIDESPDTDCNGRPELEYQDQGTTQATRIEREIVQYGAGKWNSNWWSSEPGMGRVATGIPHRVDRLRAIGNAQVPIVAALAWLMLSKATNKHVEAIP